jgi:hypothetical protein
MDPADQLLADTEIRKDPIHNPEVALIYKRENTHCTPWK